MLKKEREREIVSMLKNTDGFMTIKELCKKLYASESSIRRDLKSLENKGILKKTYGGAELITNYSMVIAFNKRAHHNTAAKKIIAKKAASLIKNGDIIFLDQSSSVFYLANVLSVAADLTVVTNNIEIINLLSATNIKVISSGGCLSRENRTCLVGNDAIRVFENIYADICFFSAKSLSDGGTISDCTQEEVEIRRAMYENARKKVFLCDSEKFGTRSPYKQCELRDTDYLISESDDAQKFRLVCDAIKIL